MKHLVRQTTISFDAAKKNFENSPTIMSGCCHWLNEIGVMAKHGNNKAEDFLCTILKTRHENYLLRIAYAYLTFVIEEKSDQTKDTLRDFEAEQQHAHVIATTKRFVRNKFVVKK